LNAQAEYIKEPFIRVIQARKESTEKLNLTVEFSFSQNFLEIITLENIKEAYRNMDRRIKLKYSVSIYEKGILLNRKVAEKELSKKWVLYWTRDPTILERYRTNIWVLGIDENLESEFFMDFEEAKTFLFSLRETFSVQPESFADKGSKVFAVVRVRSHRHSFIEAIDYKVRSDTVTIV
jgi:hypothetical protein